MTSAHRCYKLSKISFVTCKAELNTTDIWNNVLNEQNPTKITQELCAEQSDTNDI